MSCVFPGIVRGAGMFADSGAVLPPGVGTSTPEDVARGIIRAIERNRAEVDVAPLPLRAGANVAGLAPGTAWAVQKRLGAAGIAPCDRRRAAGEALAPGAAARLARPRSPGRYP